MFVSSSRIKDMVKDNGINYYRLEGNLYCYTNKHILTNANNTRWIHIRKRPNLQLLAKK